MAGKKKDAAKETKQLEIEGARDEKDPQIRRLTNAYIKARDERMTLTKAEVKARTKLELKLQEKGLKTYNDGDYQVTLEVVDKVKAKRLEESGDDDSQTEIEDGADE